MPYFEIGTFQDRALFLSIDHLLVLFIFIVFVFSLYLFRSSIKDPIRWLLIGLLAGSEISLIVWSLAVGQWDIRFNLPLQLCTISLYFCLVMLITRNYFIFEVVYFFGLAGALQAMLTPDLFYTFPHFRFFHFFIAHIAIILAILLYMVWVEEFSVSMKSVFKSMIVLNILAMIAFIANLMTGANYMFLARKPANPSILDYLGPYPWYILSLELLALIMFILLYLPFRKQAKQTT
ncbi:YwaF family protein [Halalkalibacter akibai]|uniref:TIGR02206 family membrane protein n=1 Tax=Halalkalibacter akibai (strain ATCC 43226 / DSM 21942 / CIP 109018 / JCM 9157 / 1139) TaxID=1236973 RepID=W4QZ47_HALA3|nr:TIGR02206 family membrane protein [Halalkalibacter akibai]GAE36928.1 hypothetical protein JCM9157_4164 [Halalkalibacter akibai JCM 9157]